MQEYLEARETRTDDIPAEHIGADVTGMSDKDKDAVEALLRANMVSTSYEVYLHIHNHEENAKCIKIARGLRGALVVIKR